MCEFAGNLATVGTQPDAPSFSYLFEELLPSALTLGTEQSLEEWAPETGDGYRLARPSVGSHVRCPTD